MASELALARLGLPIKFAELSAWFRNCFLVDTLLFVGRIDKVASTLTIEISLFVG